MLAVQEYLRSGKTTEDIKSFCEDVGDGQAIINWQLAVIVRPLRIDHCDLHQRRADGYLDGLDKRLPRNAIGQALLP